MSLKIFGPCRGLSVHPESTTCQMGERVPYYFTHSFAKGHTLLKDYTRQDNSYRRDVYTLSLVYGTHCVREISYGKKLPRLPETAVLVRNLASLAA